MALAGGSVPFQRTHHSLVANWMSQIYQADVTSSQVSVAAKLGLKFNVGKCSFHSLSKGRATNSSLLHIQGTSLRCLEEGESECY
jgi:hypothetical protein